MAHKTIRQSKLVLGSRVREGSGIVRRGTVVGIYTDRHMREEVALVKWDLTSHGTSHSFVSQLSEVKA